MTTQRGAVGVEPPEVVADRTGEVLAGLDQDMPAVLDFYTDLHRHPELSTQEHRTAAAVARRLREAGYQVTEGVGGTGVVGLLANGDGPVVFLRADMDALPVAERTGLDYASTVTGTTPDGETTPVMHACGHDTHVTSLVTTARALAAHRDAWRGTVFACAQPAEETGEGAAAMLRDGLFRRFGRPTVALGQHLGPLPAGSVGHNAGLILSASVNIDVHLHGKGGHGSMPEATVDPVVMAASLLMKLQTIRSRELGGSVPGVLTAGVLKAGTKHNVIPDQASLGLNLRTQSDEVQQQVLASIRRMADAEAEAFRAPHPPEISTFACFPVTHNHPDVVSRVQAVQAAYLGDEHVLDLPTLLASEDFSEYGIPGADRYDGDPVPYGFWFFGAYQRERYEQAPGTSPREKMAALPGPHQATFAPSAEPALRGGVAALTAAALAWLPAR